MFSVMLLGAGLITEASKSLICPFCHVKTQQEGSGYEPGRGSPPECDRGGTLMLNF